METWDMIKADREVFADYLAGLSPDEWDAPTLCDAWSVKAVSTHMLVTSTVPKGKIVGSFLKAGFNLDKMSAKFVDEMAALTGDEIVAKTRESAGSQSTPPGLKPAGVLNEVLIHSADIAEPRGKPIGLPVEHHVVALDHLKGVNPVFKAKQRIAGLRLTATDADWQTGDGPSVEGPALSLLLAMSGRPTAFDQLSGDGVDTMRSR